MKSHKITEPYAQIPTLRNWENKKPKNLHRHKITEPYAQIPTKAEKLTPEEQFEETSQNNRALRSNPNNSITTCCFGRQYWSQNNRALRSNPNPLF